MGTKLKPSEHDAWDRSEPDEPRMALLARDVLAPPLVRAYAAAIAGDVQRVQACFVALVRKMSARTYRPDKDAQHVISARNIANDMDIWYIGKQRPVMNERQVANELRELISTTSSYGEVSIENRTGPHSAAADRWAVVEMPENRHLQARETVFVGPGAERRARLLAQAITEIPR